METVSLSPSFVFYVFVVTSTLGVVAKLYKWFKNRRVSNSALFRIQVRYFLCYFTFMAGFNFQGPYVYRRYIDTGIPSEQISTIMSVFNIVSAFWGFFVGQAAEILGHKPLIVLSALFLGMSAFCRYIGGFWFFIASSVLMGLSTASNRVVFEDWLIRQLQTPGIPESAYATVQENSSLITLLMQLVMTPLSTKVNVLYGSGGVFLVSSALFTLSAVTIIALMQTSSIDSGAKKTKRGYLSSLSTIIRYMRSSKMLVLTLFADFCYSVFLLLYTPRWSAYHQVSKGEMLPLAQMSSANQMALMNGAQIFGMLLKLIDSSSSLALSGVASLACQLLMLTNYDINKNYVFAAYLATGMCDGVVGSAMRMTRGHTYPKDVRAHILGLLRVPTSLTTSALLYFYKSSGPKTILMISSLFMLTAVSTFIVLAVFSKKNAH